MSMGAQQHQRTKRACGARERVLVLESSGCGVSSQAVALRTSSQDGPSFGCEPTLAVDFMGRTWVERDDELVVKTDAYYNAGQASNSIGMASLYSRFTSSITHKTMRCVYALC